MNLTPIRSGNYITIADLIFRLAKSEKLIQKVNYIVFYFLHLSQKYFAPLIPKRPNK